MLASNGEAPVPPPPPPPPLFWPGFFPVLSCLVTYSKGVERYAKPLMYLTCMFGFNYAVVVRWGLKLEMTPYVYCLANVLTPNGLSFKEPCNCPNLFFAVMGLPGEILQVLVYQVF